MAEERNNIECTIHMHYVVYAEKALWIRTVWISGFSPLCPEVITRYEVQFPSAGLSILHHGCGFRRVLLTCFRSLRRNRQTRCLRHSIVRFPPDGFLTCPGKVLSEFIPVEISSHSLTQSFRFFDSFRFENPSHHTSRRKSYEHSTREQPLALFHVHI